MKCQLILKKYSINQDSLDKKLNELGKVEISKDHMTNRIELEGSIDPTKLKSLQEIAEVLIEEKEPYLFSQKDLREDVLRIAKKFNNLNLKVKTYPGVKIPANSIKGKLKNPLKYSNIQLDENSPNTILIELFNHNRLYYRIFSFKEKELKQDKSKYANITVLIEHPRITDEISDFLRLCLIFNLKFKVIHSNAYEFNAMLNKAKALTKGKLSDFNVDVIKSLDQIHNVVKIGFSKHASNDEKDLIKFLKENKNKHLLFIFGNDTYGLTQESRDKLEHSFRLTPDRIKPLKANQALSYVLGIYSTI